MTYTRRVVVDRERFAAAVREGLTNPELAERFGIPKSTVNEWAARVRGALVERAADADTERVPYREFCRQRAACAGRKHCPLDPTCAD